MEDNLKILLKEYGLDDNETKVFLFLVGNKELTAYAIAKEIKIHRSTCYDVLERLISKGFVSQIEKNGNKCHSANEISKVISQIKDKEALLLSLMPELQKLEKIQETKIKFLEGTEGQKQFNFNLFHLIKQAKVSYVYVLSNGRAAHTTSNIFLERLLKEAKKQKLGRAIDYKGIWDTKFKADSIVNLYNFGENRFLKDLPTKATTVIFEDHIAYLFTTDKPQVIEIRNSLVAKEMKSYFLHLWDIAQR